MQFQHYYNEWERYPAQWLRNLSDDGQIPAGIVDETDIRKVQADDIRSATHAHFFAGIGGWPIALRIAGWPATRPVWTGSCPCQPFSSAGQRKGDTDERHLWPYFRGLIAECLPATIFGEQVASGLGRDWLAGVRADLEALGYEVGAADLCAASVGSPHIRQRLFWVANTRCRSDERWVRPDQAHGTDATAKGEAQQRQRGWPNTGSGSSDHRVANAKHTEWRTFDNPCRDEGRDSLPQREKGSGGLGGNIENSGMGFADSAGRQSREPSAATMGYRHSFVAASGPDFWEHSVWLTGADGKARRIEPGLTPLAHGIQQRTSKLRAYGNAIVPQVAAVFIKAFMETEAS